MLVSAMAIVLASVASVTLATLLSRFCLAVLLWSIFAMERTAFAGDLKAAPLVAPAEAGATTVREP